MRIAVTGHRGFLGSHMVAQLDSLGYDVVVVEGDVREAELPVVDGFMHFAATMGGVGFFSKAQFTPVLDNLLMDARVIQHCQKHCIRLLYPSSACAYPVSRMEEGVALHEELLWEPAEPDQMYGMEKLCVTRLARYADFDFRVPVLHTVYGEGQAYISAKVKFPPQICYKFATQSPVEVWGSGAQTRTFLHINDAIVMLLEVFMANNYHGCVNVSHPREVSVREVVDVLARHTGKSDIVFNTTMPTGPMRRLVDNTKFYAHYKHRPRVDIEEGFVRLYDHIAQEVTSRSANPGQAQGPPAAQRSQP